MPGYMSAESPPNCHEVNVRILVALLAIISGIFIGGIIVKVECSGQIAALEEKIALEKGEEDQPTAKALTPDDFIAVKIVSDLLGSGDEQWQLVETSDGQRCGVMYFVGKVGEQFTINKDRLKGYDKVDGNPYHLVLANGSDTDSDIRKRLE